MKDERSSRRNFLRSLAAGTGSLYLAPGLLSAADACAVHHAPVEVNDMGWDRVPGILARIVPPSFRARDYVITTYGARADGVTDCTNAFRKAIAECSAAGGGRVIVPPGRFSSGAIHLRSN